MLRTENVAGGGKLRVSKMLGDISVCDVLTF